MKLYAVTISGHKYYFIGDLTASDIKKIDKYCDTLNQLTDSKDVLSILKRFINNNLKCFFDQVAIEYIFRINL